MIWEDYGFLLSKNKFGENSSITEFYTNNHGKVSGIIYGSTSKKIKNYLQIGNKFHINYSTKNENKAGYLKVEIDSILTPIFFDDHKKLSCIISSMNLIKLLTVEHQINPNIFNLIENFFKILNEKNWLNSFIFWELEFFKLIGYNLEFKNLVKEEIVDNKKIYFVLSNQQKKLIPNFLVENNFNEINKESLLSALKLNSDYLDKTILKPNNIPTPKSRNDLINLIKK
tara:strand:- start:333 stop:1016 length:684 start_codon:yes stop_codon:yes gene_type:complete